MKAKIKGVHVYFGQEMSHSEPRYVHPQLIAAAPDLLAALKNLVQFYAGTHTLLEPQWRKAREAIAKAEGRKL